MVTTTIERDEQDLQRVQTLGSVRLHREGTKEVILIPTPSDDPNDPLNWSRPFRYYIAFLVCAAMFFCNFLAAGPTVAIVNIVIDFFGTPPTTPAFLPAIAKVAYFFTSTALIQGMSNLVWMPLIVKYGRRPVYISSFTLYTISAIWAGVSRSYGSELAARMVLGFAAGSGECVAPLTIADLFFLHERGLVMACYTAALSCGVSGGIIIAGLITIKNDWRVIYYVATGLIGGLTLLVFFTMPETAYSRDYNIHPGLSSRKPSVQHPDETKGSDVHQVESGPAPLPVKRTYGQSLRIFSGTYTTESLGKIFLRPILFLALPPVLWATLVMSVTIGFLVAITTNVASSFGQLYGFAPWQSGLTFVAGLIGAFIGIYAGGSFSDLVANWLTQRNGGIREPEMRLPSIIPGMIAAPVALVLFGVGIEKQLHWMVPTLGLGLLNFAIAQATNVSLVYTIDAYRPVAGEVVVTQLAFKAAFGFLLSFYTNPWIAEAGYANAFGAMAGISGAVMLLWIPLYIWGKRIRTATTKWSFLRWEMDREVGE